MAVTRQLLVVDDDPSLLLAVSETLRAEGYEVVTARRASEAMVRVAESLPDLIISDIRMPGMDGYALARNLRSAPRTRLVPIVFLTAKDDLSDRIRSEEHTSELQSLAYLVCRLLLEKKKNTL